MWRKQEQQVYMHPQHPQQQTLHEHGIISTDERAHHRLTHHNHRSSGMDMLSPSNPRALRNRAEKQRRDNLNTNISMMGELVPAVAKSPKKMDKISILRLAAAFLRTYYTLGRGTIDFLPPELEELILEQFIDKLIDSWGFLIVLTTVGKVVYVSRKVQDHLGHTQTDLVGHSLYDFVHEDDRKDLMRNITLNEMPGYSSTLQITDVANDSSNSSEDSTSLRNEKKPFREQRRTFELRMLRRTASKREHAQYECLEISGLLRLADACKSPELAASRTKHRGVSSNSNDIIFVGVARLLTKRPITAISIMDANKNEYITRHLVDGRIVYCDHRVSVVTGYLSEEVSGVSAFGFMHVDDYKWPITALCQMYDRAETCGTSCYRLRSKTGEFIYLSTHGYLEYDDKRTVVSYVCINTLVPEEEGRQLMEQMKKRFSTTVSETTRSMIQSREEAALLEVASSSKNAPWNQPVPDPKIQFEEAIEHLVNHLSPTASKEPLAASPAPNEQYSNTVIVSQPLPAVDVQDSKIGNENIDNYPAIQSKEEDVTPKQESKTIRQQARSNEKQEICRSPGKTIVVSHMQRIHDGGVQDGQNVTITERRMTSMIAMSKSIIEECDNVADVTETSHLDVPQSILDPGAVEESITSVSNPLCDDPCEIKVEHFLDVFEHQGESIIDYPENSVVENSGITSDSEPNHEYALKRKYSDSDLRATSNKKRHNIVSCLPTDTNEDLQSVSYVDCEPSINEEFLGPSTDFSQYNDINSQPLKNAESPNSTLNDVNVNYQQVDSSEPLLPLNPDDEFISIPGLDTNPDFVTMLDDPRNVPIFEINNAISNELMRRHIQLGNSMALQASEINVLTQCVNNPGLRAKRESLTSLQAEHNRQKHILETLQQDHRNIIIIKHNIDV